MPESSLLAGIALVALGGVFNGTSAAPMKFTPLWKWEHIWLVYSISGMVVLPWIVAVVTTPHLGQLISEAPLVLICGFGFLWGVGSVFCGLALVRLGLGLAGALILGVVVGVGSLVPMFLLHAGAMNSRPGRFVLGGNAILIAGISLCAYAGHLREKQQPGTGNGPSGKQSLLIGLLIAILAGVFGAALNFSFAFSGTIQGRAVELGASPGLASMSVWALTVSAGFLANAGYCIWRMRRSGWAPFKLPNTGLYWLGGLLMGLLWFGGIVVYGIGGAKLGGAGPVIGWPVMLGVSVIASNITGGLIGEWRGTGRRCFAFLASGIAAIIVATVLIAQGKAM